MGRGVVQCMIRAPVSYQCGPGSNPAPDVINGSNLLLVLVFLRCQFTNTLASSSELFRVS